MSKKRASVERQSGLGARRAAAQTEQGRYFTERRAKLSDAAAALFKERGLRNVSLQEIAERAGFNRATIYYYAASKEEIFFDIAFSAMDRFVTRAETIRYGDGGADIKIRRFIVAMMEHYETAYPHMYVFMQEHLNSLQFDDQGRQQQLIALSSRVEDQLLAIIDDGVATGTLRSDLTPRIFAYAILGMVNWSYRWFRPGGALSGAEIAHQFADAILDGTTPAAL